MSFSGVFSTGRCLQQPDSGNCVANLERFFYNPAAQECQTFVYGGCGGNNNRFMTFEHCESACEGVQLETTLPVTTVPVTTTSSTETSTTSTSTTTTATSTTSTAAGTTTTTTPGQISTRIWKILCKRGLSAYTRKTFSCIEVYIFICKPTLLV